ncbi:MAG TPA: hypothetical protein PJ982_12375 [Lacipirellulaceae bacterium]|nr:hypothetical protein [Lacipirellulaceae bacterium]
MMWLATLDDAIADPLGPVWTTPADCEAGISLPADAMWSPAAGAQSGRYPLL